MAKDKKGKGSGTKDACYHKVKSRYSVWPSAYASGALVKCRKVGAKNWGNKSESFEVQEGRPMYDPERVKKATSLPAINPKQDPRKNKTNLSIGRSADAGEPNADKILKKRTGGASLPPKFKKEEVESVEEGKSSRPMGEPFHTMSRGMKQKRGAKRNEGDGKYVKMQHIKRANKREADLEAHRERQRNERGLSMYPEEVEVTEGKYSKSETYVKGTAPVRATYGGKTESFPKETYKKKTTKTEELNIDLAVDYFFTEGINEDGLEMIIEETGLEKFVEFVEYLTDIEVLTEARAARKARKGAKSYEQVKAEIDAKEKAKSAKREISVDKTKKATETAKAKQPEKKPVRDAIARGVFRAVDAYKKGMERHNAAMATAKKAGKVAGKAAGEFAKGAGEGVKTAGKAVKMAHAVATKEEVEVEEGYKEIDKAKENRMYRRAGNLARKSLSSTGAKKKEAASKSAKIVSAISRQKENERFAKMGDEKARDNYEEVSASVQRMLDEAGKKCWKGYKKAGTQKLFGKTYNRCVKANEELSIDQQMKISRDYNRMSPEEKKAANKKAMGDVKKVAPKKDTRTDAEKMADAYASPRKGPGGATRAD